jgi:DNA-binding LacI/PurR family transcriptional regulator
VSHQTVSRVLNGHPSIRPATRARVLAAIEELNYRPSGAARALATRRSRRIGVVVDTAIEYGPNSTLRAVEAAAQQAGYAATAIAIDEDRAVSPHDAVEHLMGQGVDALCVIAPRESSVDVLRELTADVPTLVVKATPEPAFLTVAVDQELGATLAVRHLIELGHRKILHVAGPLDWLDARGRVRGWHVEMARGGLVEHDPVVGDWTSDFGYEFARQFTDMPDFTAIFAANDQLALGIIHGFAERGIRVPDDVSVIGFDDLPDARHFLPPLSTVRQDFRALGERAVSELLAVLAGGQPEAHSLIAPELVVRESTARPRG